MEYDFDIEHMKSSFTLPKSVTLKLNLFVCNSKLLITLKIADQIYLNGTLNQLIFEQYVLNIRRTR